MRPSRPVLFLHLTALLAAPPSWGQSAEPRPAEPRPAEPRPAEPRPAEPRPAEPRPAEPRPAEPRPAEPRPAEPRPGAPGSTAAPDAPGAGSGAPATTPPAGATASDRAAPPVPTAGAAAPTAEPPSSGAAPAGADRRDEARRATGPGARPAAGDASGTDAEVTVATRDEPQRSLMDTRLSFSCAHEDVFRDPRVLPSTPGFHCGRPTGLGVLFFDNYDTRYSGFETLSHLALYRRFDRNRWEMEGGLLIRINELAEDNVRLADGGSFVRIAYWLDPSRRRPERLALVAFPVSSDRMRLGYSYRLSWGGSPEFFKSNPDSPQSSGKNPEAVPGIKLQFDSDRLYAYVGLKSSVLLDRELGEKRSVHALLAGAGVDLTDMLRVELSGGYFSRGKNEAADVLGEPVHLFGASAQVSIHEGMPVGSSIDYKLYRNTPEDIRRLFRKETYPGGLTWLAAAEATVLGQTLKDGDMTGSTAVQYGFAGDVNLRAKIDYTRFKLDLMARDLAFLLHSIPSLPPYWSFPSSYETSPELFVALGGDHHFPGPALTLGATVGLDLPATITTPQAEDLPGNMSTGRTMVVRHQADRSVLPDGTDVLPIWAVKGSARVDFGDSFATLADLYYQYDPNTVRYDRSDPEGAFTQSQFATFHQLGFHLSLEARF